MTFPVTRGSLIIEVRNVGTDVPISYGRVSLERTSVIFESLQVDYGRYALLEVPAGAYRLRYPTARMRYSSTPVATSAAETSC